VEGPDHHHPAPFTNHEMDSDCIALLRKDSNKIEDPDVVVGPDLHHPQPVTNPEMDSDGVAHFASISKNMRIQRWWLDPTTTIQHPFGTLKWTQTVWPTSQGIEER